MVMRAFLEPTDSNINFDAKFWSKENTLDLHVTLVMNLFEEGEERDLQKNKSTHRCGTCHTHSNA